MNPTTDLTVELKTHFDAFINAHNINLELQDSNRVTDSIRQTLKSWKILPESGEPLYNTKSPSIKTEDTAEFTGQLIDILEDILESRNIQIPNPEKDDDPDNAAIIYGSDYGFLQDRIEETLIENNICEPYF